MFRNHKISELKSGGDKRDRTSDLLNAIVRTRRTQWIKRYKQSNKSKNNA